MAVTVINEQKDVRIEREFVALYAQARAKKLEITYEERTYVNDELISTKDKTYNRDYDFWAASELGTTILEMIDNDLQNPNLV